MGWSRSPSLSPLGSLTFLSWLTLQTGEMGVVGGGRQEGENIPAGSSPGMEDGEGALVGRILVPRGVRILSPESENLLPVMTKGTLLLWMRILGRQVLLGGWATWTQCNHKGPCERRRQKGQHQRESSTRTRLSGAGERGHGPRSGRPPGLEKKGTEYPEHPEGTKPCRCDILAVSPVSNSDLQSCKTIGLSCSKPLSLWQCV